jgi:hypothetical protein
MSLSAKRRVLDSFIRAYRLHHGHEPSISELKGYLWIDGRGGYMLEEIEDKWLFKIYRALRPVAVE